MKQRILLIDSFGAFISALLLVILAYNQDIFGMPGEMLQLLFPIPVLYSIFSLLTYKFVKKNWPVFLKIIAIANLAYCGLTLLITAVHFDKLTKIGVTYFVLEIIVIAILAIVECRIAFNKNN
jgi:hypothetical protein